VDVHFGVLREAQRRATYERLYAKFREARRAFVAAEQRGASTSEVRLRQQQLYALWERPAAWRREV
jgi:hypothetical protein